VLFGWQGRFSVAAVTRACGAEPPDVAFAPSTTRTASFLAGCGEPGLAAYRDLQVVDLCYPAAQALFVLALLGLLLPRAARRPGLLAAVPVAAAAGDYAENVCAWLLLADPRTASGAVALVLQGASAVKVVLTWASWLLVTSLLAHRAATAIRARAARSPGPHLGR
jgi:hypothetical protein